MFCIRSLTPPQAAGSALAVQFRDVEKTAATILIQGSSDSGSGSKGSGSRGKAPVFVTVSPLSLSASDSACTSTSSRSSANAEHSSHTVKKNNTGFFASLRMTCCSFESLNITWIQVKFLGVKLDSCIRRNDNRKTHLTNILDHNTQQ